MPKHWDFPAQFNHPPQSMNPEHTSFPQNFALLGEHADRVMQMMYVLHVPTPNTSRGVLIAPVSFTLNLPKTSPLKLAQVIYLQESFINLELPGLTSSQ